MNYNGKAVGWVVSVRAKVEWLDGTSLARVARLLASTSLAALPVRSYDVTIHDHAENFANHNPGWTLGRNGG